MNKTIAALGAKHEARKTMARLICACVLTLLLVNCTPVKRDPQRVVESTAVDADFELPLQAADEAALQRALARLHEQDHAQVRREVGILYQRLSPPDRWDYLDAALEHLESALAELPDDPATLIYFGLAKAAHARDPKVGLFAKLSWAKRGFASMDQAVALAPDNLSCRILRAKAQLLAPPILGRVGSLERDRKWIAARLEKGEAGEDSDHIKAAANIFLGDYADRVDKDRQTARAFWQRALTLGDGSSQADIAAQRLGGRPSDF